MNFKVMVFTMLLGMGTLSLVACNHTDKASATEAKEDISVLDQSAEILPNNVVKTDTVIIKGMQFKPAKLTIHKGDQVVWINKDIVDHDISTDVNRTWSSGTIEIGKSFSTAPDKSFKYICSIHPTMKGEIVVED